MFALLLKKNNPPQILSLDSAIRLKVVRLSDNSSFVVD